MKVCCRLCLLRKRMVEELTSWWARHLLSPGSEHCSRTMGVTSWSSTECSQLFSSSILFSSKFMLCKPVATSSKLCLPAHGPCTQDARFWFATSRNLLSYCRRCVNNVHLRTMWAGHWLTHSCAMLPNIAYLSLCMHTDTSLFSCLAHSSFQVPECCWSDSRFVYLLNLFCYVSVSGYKNRRRGGVQEVVGPDRSLVLVDARCVIYEMTEKNHNVEENNKICIKNQ